MLSLFSHVTCDLPELWDNENQKILSGTERLERPGQKRQRQRSRTSTILNARTKHTDTPPLSPLWRRCGIALQATRYTTRTQTKTLTHLSHSLTLSHATHIEHVSAPLRPSQCYLYTHTHLL